MSLWICPTHGLYGGDVFCPRCGGVGEYATVDDVAPEDDAVSDQREESGMTQTFWNYAPTPARKIRVIVGPCLRPTFWHNGLEGTEREAVEVNYHGDVFYLDNEDGSGWDKVTGGRGGPEWVHSELPVAQVLGPVAESDAPEGDA